MTARTPKQGWCPWPPSPAKTRDPYSLPPKYHGGIPLGRIVLRRVVEKTGRILGEVAGIATGHVVEQLVLEADVGERAPDHHLRGARREP